MNWQKHAFSTATMLIVATAFSRLIPHWPNFTPVMAIALFAGATFATKRSGVLIAIGAMVLSDLALGAILGWDYAFHASQWAVYGSIVAIVALGTLFKNKKALSTIGFGGLAAGVLFYLVTNFAVWLGGTIYPQTLEGLVACYTAGLAFYSQSGSFFWNGIVSTWMFSALLFGAYAVVNKQVKANCLDIS